MIGQEYTMVLILYLLLGWDGIKDGFGRRKTVPGSKPGKSGSANNGADPGGSYGGGCCY